MSDKTVNSFGFGFPDENDKAGDNSQVDVSDQSRVSQPPIGNGTYKMADNDMFIFKGDDETECDVDSAISGDFSHGGERLPDLEWLENIVQDPKRLPVNPIDLSVRELLHQWGKYRSGDERTEVISETGSYSKGIRLSSVNKDLDAVRAEKKKKLSDGAAKDIIRSEFSKLAHGVDKKLVIANVKERLGSQIKDYKDYIIKEYGLKKKAKVAKKTACQCGTCQSNVCKCGNLGLQTHDEDAPRQEFTRKADLKKIKDPSSIKRAEYVNRLIKAGLIGLDDGNSIMSKSKSLSDVKKYASQIINRPKVAEYEGVPVSDFGLTSSVGSERSGEVSKLLKFAREEMTEGWAGEGLDNVIKLSHSPVLIKKASAQLNNLRNEHEGLSGFLYVDAEAYGGNVKGCEKGGLKHRANDIPYVLEMKKCAGCVHRNNNNCSKYKKELINKDMFEQEELDSYKRNILASVSNKDYQNTANMFLDGNTSVRASLDPTKDVFGVQLGEEELNTNPYKESQDDNSYIPGFAGFYED